ncbi:MAG: thioredoxin-like domain-containing protein [Phocaeicola sp.]
MIKSVKWIFVVCFTSSFFFSSFAGKDATTEGVTVGDTAPLFTLESNEQTVSLQQLQGSYVLLSFWASYDAQSRISNALLNHAVSKEGRVKMVSVSFDEYQSIFNESIKKDQLSMPSCFVELGGTSSDLYKKYQLNRGFRNFLLNERGVIIAKNIEASALTSYIQ